MRAGNASINMTAGRVQHLAHTIARNPHHRSPAPEAASSQLGRTHGGGRLGPALRSLPALGHLPWIRCAARVAERVTAAMSGLPIEYRET